MRLGILSMLKVFKVFLVLVFLQLFSSSSALNLNIFKPNPAQELIKASESISTLVDTPYKQAAKYMPVLERALTLCKVPFKAKEMRVERLVYDLRNDSSIPGDPVEKLIADINIERNGLLGQVITAKGKLNDWDLSYINDFKFSIFGKGTMKIESTLANKPFINLDIFSNKRSKLVDVNGNLFGRKTQYCTKTSSTEGYIDSQPYKVEVEDVKKNGEVVAIRSKGSIGSYEIKGHGRKINDNYYEIEEYYGPLFIKTKVQIMG